MKDSTNSGHWQQSHHQAYRLNSRNKSKNTKLEGGLWHHILGPAVTLTLTFDLQNLIRSKLFKPFIGYRGNNIRLDERNGLKTSWPCQHCRNQLPRTFGSLFAHHNKAVTSSALRHDGNLPSPAGLWNAVLQRCSVIGRFQKICVYLISRFDSIRENTCPTVCFCFCVMTQTLFFLITPSKTSVAMILSFRLTFGICLRIHISKCLLKLNGGRHNQPALLTSSTHAQWLWHITYAFYIHVQYCLLTDKNTCRYYRPQTNQCRNKSSGRMAPICHRTCSSLHIPVFI